LFITYTPCYLRRVFTTYVSHYILATYEPHSTSEVTHLVEALRYKSEGRGFYSR